MALVSPLVTTDIIMLNLFPYLAVRYQADDVPTTVVNGVKALVGVQEEADAVATICAIAAGGTPATLPTPVLRPAERVPRDTPS